MRHENKGALKVRMDYKVACELSTDDVLKSNQCAMDGGSIASKNQK